MNPHGYPRDPKSRASASSATLAQVGLPAERFPLLNLKNTRRCTAFVPLDASECQPIRSGDVGPTQPASEPCNRQSSRGVLELLIWFAGRPLPLPCRLPCRLVECMLRCRSLKKIARPAAERCESGRIGVPGEHESWQRDRGFESHPLRQTKLVRLRSFAVEATGFKAINAWKNGFQTGTMGEWSPCPLVLVDRARGSESIAGGYRTRERIVYVVT